MMIRSLRLDGFLSFAPGSDPFEMRPLNVLIGPNGAGKSNVIEALDLLAATPNDLARAVRIGGGSAEWLWKGEPEAAEATIEVVLDRGCTPTRRDLRYRLSFAPVAGQMKLQDEAVEELAPMPGTDDVYFYYRFQRGNPVINIRDTGDGSSLRRYLVREPLPDQSVRQLRPRDLIPDQSVLSQRKDPEQYPEVTWAGRKFSEIWTFTEWTFGPGMLARYPQRTTLPEDQLLSDSSNLAMVLNHIELAGKKRVDALLKRFFPRFESLPTRIREGTAELNLLESDFNAPIRAIRLSDGTLRFVALLALLLSPSPPPLLCIEEPELGLHPDAVALLADLLVDASSRTQLVVTTHSESLIAALTSQPEAIVACERPGSATTLRRLDPAKVASWLDEYSLGDMWRMGELGANP